MKLFVLLKFCLLLFVMCLVAYSANAQEASSKQQAVSEPPEVRPVIQASMLAWLKRDLSCDEFRDEVRSRFSLLGSYSELPANSQEILRKVFEVACSRRFEFCRFTACGLDESAGAARYSVESGLESVAETNKKVEPELVSKRSQADLTNAIERRNSFWQRAIQAREEYEKKRRLTWHPIGMSSDARSSMFSPSDYKRVLQSVQ